MVLLCTVSLRKVAALIALVAALVVPGAALGAPGRPAPAYAGECGLPTAAPLWADYGWPDLADTFGRPGVVVSVSTGGFPAQMRDAGAANVYFDLYLNKRVGQPTAPADPSTIVDKANKLFDFAVQQTACQTPVIAENELFGAGLVTPWSDGNAQYRQNVLAFLQQLAARGAHPVLLVNSKPYTAGDAGTWWQQVAAVSDIVREDYVPATAVWKAGPIVGNRMLRMNYRRSVKDFTDIGILPNRLGIMVSFSTTPGFGGRNGLQPADAWFQVAKWEALAAKQVAAETAIASVWSWGWAEWTAAEQDPAKGSAACVWLWARQPSLCDAPGLLGSGFDSSLTEGQIRLTPGIQCTVGKERISNDAIQKLQLMTGDRDTAFTALYERLVENAAAKAPTAKVLAVERAVIADQFGGSRSAYLAALAAAHANVTIARGILGDQLRRAQIETKLYAPPASDTQIRTFYSSYPELPVRQVQAKPAPSWLGRKQRGLALSEVAPDRLFGLGDGRATTVRTAEGLFRIKTLGAVQQLGAVPLAQARTAIAAALRRFARGDAFERWTEARQHSMLDEAICARDELPQPAAVDLTQYLPFLQLP